MTLCPDCTRKHASRHGHPRRNMRETRTSETDPIIGPWPGIEAEMQAEIRRGRRTTALILLATAAVTALLMWFTSRLPDTETETHLPAVIAAEQVMRGRF